MIKLMHLLLIRWLSIFFPMIQWSWLFLLLNFWSLFTLEDLSSFKGSKPLFSWQICHWDLMNPSEKCYLLWDSILERILISHAHLVFSVFRITHFKGFSWKEHASHPLGIILHWFFEACWLLDDMHTFHLIQVSLILFELLLVNPRVSWCTPCVRDENLAYKYYKRNDWNSTNFVTNSYN